MNPWWVLFIAGFFEIGFTTFMKLSAGFTKPAYVVAFAICAISSFVMLNRAMVQIPLGTAYAVWTGIGAFGTAVVGIFLFKDPASLMRILLLTNLIGSIVGLKFFSTKG